MEARLERVVRQMKRAAADADALLEARGQQFDGNRGAISSRIERVTDQLTDYERDGARFARETARNVGRYAQDNPWRVTGTGLAVALAVGAVAWFMLAQKD